MLVSSIRKNYEKYCSVDRTLLCLTPTVKGFHLILLSLTHIHTQEIQRWMVDASNTWPSTPHFSKHSTFFEKPCHRR